MDKLYAVDNGVSEADRIGPQLILLPGRAMTIALTVLYIFAIFFVGQFLFLSVDLLEPNPRLAVILKCALLGVGGAAIHTSCAGAALTPRDGSRIELALV